MILTKQHAFLTGITMVLASFCPQPAKAEQPNPRADEKAVVTEGNARFTILTPELIRIEYSDNGVFEDNATFAVVNRRLPVPDFTVSRTDSTLLIRTDKAALNYRTGTDPRRGAESLTISIDNAGKPATWYYGLIDSLNLGGTRRTLDNFKGNRNDAGLEPGLVSRSGWAVIDESFGHERADGSHSFALVPNETMGYDWIAERADRDALDIYFFGYGDNYKKAVSDFTKIGGRIPLPPAFVFGYWYSRYDAYNSDQFREIARTLKEKKIPSDVLIIDMDWHWNGNEADNSAGRGGWTGWSWNTNLIPDAKELIADIHKMGLRTALNLHPADGIDSVESPQYFAEMNRTLRGKYHEPWRPNPTIPWVLDSIDFTRAFFDTVLADHEKEGVDFWWTDWQQWLTSPYTIGLGQTFWINHVFFNEMASRRKDRRPLIFHRWGGPGSHRYQIGFSGDTYIDYRTLEFEPYFTATASNLGYGYWGHDLGGHQPAEKELINDPELLLRWLQYGVFSPIFRTHATRYGEIERRLWVYDNFPDMLEAMRLRYTLFPYLYTMARKAYDTGISICRPMYYEYPRDQRAYDYDGQYYFGDNIIAAPITSPADSTGMAAKRIWLPEGLWLGMADKKIYKAGEHELKYGPKDIPWFVRAGAVIPMNPETVMSMTEHPDNLILTAVAGADGTSTIYEDAGDNSDYATVYAETKMRLNGRSLEVEPRSGSDSGLPTSRSYTVIIYNVDKPGKVKIDGKKVASAYNPSTRSLTIAIPSKDTSKGFNVTW